MSRSAYSFYLCQGCTDYASEGEPGDYCATCGEPYATEPGTIIISVPLARDLAYVAEALAEGEHNLGDDATRAGYALAYQWPHKAHPLRPSCYAYLHFGKV